MRALYAPFIRNHDRLLMMDPRSAEFTKYAANAMLAMRISFMNELAQLAERVGVDIELVRQGIGSDPRIGTHFLYAGTGYGDRASQGREGARPHRQGQPCGARSARSRGAANTRQKKVLVDKVIARFGADLTGRKFAVWGLAFKPNTDDMREAPSCVVIRELAARGALLQAYDPVAMDMAARVLGDVPALRFVASQAAALVDADALLILTEWKEFKSPDFDLIRSALKQPVVFDGRNLYDPRFMRSLGIEYRGVGRGVA
jgi:UDPglucose 6-dehydrogenase